MKNSTKTVGFLVIALACATFAFAEGTTTPATSTPPKVKPAVDAVCMQDAIEKRDTAIVSAFDTYQLGIKTALNARKESLKSGWLQTERKARRDALKTSWLTYKTDHTKAVNTWRVAKRTAWNVFYGERKSCGPSALIDDATNHAADSQI